jgi:hypothetical protein
LLIPFGTEMALMIEIALVEIALILNHWGARLRLRRSPGCGFCKSRCAWDHQGCARIRRSVAALSWAILARSYDV